MPDKHAENTSKQNNLDIAKEWKIKQLLGRRTETCYKKIICHKNWYHYLITLFVIC